MDRNEYFKRVHERWSIEYDEKAISILNTQIINNISHFMIYVTPRSARDRHGIVSEFFHLIGYDLSVENYELIDMYSLLKRTANHSIFWFYVNTLFWVLHKCEKSESQLTTLYESIKEDIIAAGSPVNILVIDNYLFMIVPAGAKEMDNALVNDVLCWLTDYPITRRKFIETLEMHAKGEISTCLINSYRTLEEFLREFFEDRKNLPKHKQILGQYLKEARGVSEIQNMIMQIFYYYEKGLNEIAKHADKAIHEDMEYIIYQTGLFIRILIQLDYSRLNDAAN